MTKKNRKNILIVGAGEAGRMVFREIRKDPGIDSRVIGFVDDDPELEGRSIEQIPVLGTTEKLAEISRAMEVDEVIISIPTAPGRFVREMIRRCRTAGVEYKIVPGVMEIIKGDVRFDQIRNVEVEDLLGRETVDFDLDSARKELSGKKILVTGAGGSIGSELCRQLARVQPERLVLVGRGENRIFVIEEELRSAFPDLKISTVIGNLTDSGKVTRIMDDFSPDIVYHAAAHKHVHYMERDPSEAVINNVAGSINVIRAAEECGVQRFVFISTDKAADPGGVMGASKRIVELFLDIFNGRSRCRYITVRFGNVIGSSGSVVPLFLRQIERGGPVTVSEREATRFFMSVREAALLVIRSSIIGGGGETFILDMGEPLNIYEMARDIILLTGHEPETEIEIRISGLREGEKLHEALVSEKELLEPSGEDKILLAGSSCAPPAGFEEKISAMVEAARKGDNGNVLEMMSLLIPGFTRRDV
ncbi:MAG: polysaccharide biosynthesis protein [Candidatus Krumholzibacteriota bacterium]|nr:polysaccharide biosynthesis protein [Candidatus Krumholzibacteriota bacterium]